MLNCDLKIITKTFANRKNKFLEEIIHESQTAYMLQINWSRFGLEDCCIKLHPENLPIGESSFSLVTPKK